MKLKLLFLGIARAEDVPLDINVCATKNKKIAIPDATIVQDFKELLFATFIV